MTWSPTSEGANLQLWWAANDVTQTSGLVTQWPDQSGNGQTGLDYSNTQSSASLISYSATGVGGFPSSVPCVTSNGSADYIRRTGPISNSTLSCFLTFSPNFAESQNNGRVLSLVNSSQTNDYDNIQGFVIALNTGATQIYAYSDNGFIGGSVGVSNNVPLTCGVVYNGVAVAFYVNGSLVGGTTSTSATIGGVSCRVTLGGQNFIGPAAMAAGTWTELVISYGNITAANYQTYANNTWINPSSGSSQALLGSTSSKTKLSMMMIGKLPIKGTTISEIRANDNLLATMPVKGQSILQVKNKLIYPQMPLALANHSEIMAFGKSNISGTLPIKGSTISSTQSRGMLNLVQFIQRIRIQVKAQGTLTASAIGNLIALSGTTINQVKSSWNNMSGKLPILGKTINEVKLNNNISGGVPIKGQTSTQIKAKDNLTGIIGILGKTINETQLNSNIKGIVPIKGQTISEVKASDSMSGNVGIVGKTIDQIKVKSGYNLALSIMSKTTSQVKSSWNNMKGSLPILGRTINQIMAIGPLLAQAPIGGYSWATKLSVKAQGGMKGIVPVLGKTISSFFNKPNLSGSTAIFGKTLFQIKSKESTSLLASILGLTINQIKASTNSKGIVSILGQTSTKVKGIVPIIASASIKGYSQIKTITQGIVKTPLAIFGKSLSRIKIIANVSVAVPFGSVAALLGQTMTQVTAKAQALSLFIFQLDIFSKAKVIPQSGIKAKMTSQKNIKAKKIN